MAMDVMAIAGMTLVLLVTTLHFLDIVQDRLNRSR